LCDRCHTEGGEWVPTTVRGTIWSYAIYHRAFHPGFLAAVPYVVVMVESDAGLHFVGNLIGDHDGLAVGKTVRATFTDVTERFTQVDWALEASCSD
jgi:uncharacterized OB-fold protein